MEEIIGIQFPFHGYEITTDTAYQHKRYGITPELGLLLEKKAIACQTRKDNRLVEELKNLVRKYPHLPMLKNYLSILYTKRGEKLKANKINEQILQEHPGYLFGILTQANEFIENGEPEKVPLLLGESPELKDLYPERKVFHYGEFTNFLLVVIRYYAAIHNLELADNKLDLLIELAPDDPITEQAESFLWPLRLERVGNRLKEEKKQRITPVPIRFVKQSESSIPPEFNHQEINELYHNGISIPHSVLEQILALPRQSLIDDLISVLHDAADRYHLFIGKPYEEEKSHFPLHAIFLLMEIKAEETLPEILNFLEYEEAFQEFWFGDHRTGTLWQCIFQLGRNNLEVLQKFLIKPGIDTYSKTCVSNALCQMVLHYPEMRPHILNLFSAVFETFAASSVDDNLIDTDFLGLAIGSAIDCGLPELLPIIKKLYDRNYVAIGIEGNYSNVEETFSKPLKYDHKKPLMTIFELYNDVKETWFDDSDDGDNRVSDLFQHHNPQPVIQAVADKIGRNDPCPCGSGKKYKKCCMN